MRNNGLTRLVITASLMTVILIFMVIAIKNLVGEKNKIFSALLVSQHNRELIFRTEKVTESLLLVEVDHKEYCTTFKPEALEKFNKSVSMLSENLQNLQDFVQLNAATENRLIQIFGEKKKAGEIYVRLRAMTDSLIFSTAKLDQEHLKLENYIDKISKTKIDTLSVTHSVEKKKKGLFDKLKTFVAGEKTNENTNTKVLVNTSEQISQITGPSDPKNLERQLNEYGRQSDNNMSVLINRALQLKKSELHLISVNNQLINEIEKIINDIKTSIQKDEGQQNREFVNSVGKSTQNIQTILYILIVLAFLLVSYIIYLTFMVFKFQKNIISLNEKITKESIEKDKFYSILSHDLMNPFNILLGFSSMLDESIKNNNQKETKEYADIIRTSGKQIHQLLQNLLTWSRVRNGRIEFAPQWIDFNDIVMDCNAILSPVAANKEIKIQWRVDQHIQIYLDKNMINSVIQNLTTNAIKFSKRQSEIEITAIAEKEWLNITIQDHGVGMSQEKLDSLFRIDKSQSTKGTENENGSGLGLILCKEFIEKHAGIIEVKSVEGKGSEFCIALPLNKI